MSRKSAIETSSQSNPPRPSLLTTHRPASSFLDTRNRQSPASASKRSSDQAAGANPLLSPRMWVGFLIPLLRCSNASPSLGAKCWSPASGITHLPLIRPPVLPSPLRAFSYYIPGHLYPYWDRQEFNAG